MFVVFSTLREVNKKCDDSSRSVLFHCRNFKMFCFPCLLVVFGYLSLIVFESRIFAPPPTHNRPTDDRFPDSRRCWEMIELLKKHSDSHRLLLLADNEHSLSCSVGYFSSLW